MERYKVLRKLGEGGNCIAYQALDLRTERLVTIKKIKDRTEDEKEALEKNLYNEARILSDLDMETVPKLVESGKGIIVLEHIRGMSLEKVMALNGLFKENKAAKIGTELCEILRLLHGKRQPIIYRDLKPANIILRPDGHISLIDFGAARYYDMSLKCDTQNIGTVGFAAPEQFGNLGQTDPRTDIYCLGMTLLQLMTGVDPGDSEAVAALKYSGARGISHEMMKIIDKCTRPDREDRFRSVKEVQEALKEYPSKLRIKKVFLTIRTMAAAAVVALAVTGGLYHADTIKSYATEDVRMRLPFVMQRLSVAHERIEKYLTENLGVEIK